MPGGVTPVFSEANDLAAAMRVEGCFGLLVTGSGPFRGRLTQVALHTLWLSAANEHLSRIALTGYRRHDPCFIGAGRGPALIWGGVAPFFAHQTIAAAVALRYAMRRWSIVA